MAPTEPNVIVLPPVDYVPPGGETFYDPNVPAGTQVALPVAPAGESGPSGPILPEQQSIVVSYAGQIVPLLTLDGTGGGGAAAGSTLGQGTVFAMGRGGQVAAVSPDGWLYVNGAPMDVSPSSIYGMPPNLSFGDLTWSPDGQRLAFRIDAADPNHSSTFESGIWIYEPSSRRSWQVMRNGYPAWAAQLHEQQHAVSVQWSPDGRSLVVTVDTPLGRGNVLMPVEHDPNQVFEALPYAQAAWAPDSGSLIVSGLSWNGQTVVGRVGLDRQYTEYLSQAATGLYMQAALPLYDGRIAFLGSSTADSFALYAASASPGAQAARLSAPVSGTILTAEWNPERTVVLVTTQSGGGLRLWLLRTDGTTQDVTPAGGALTTAHWR